MSSSESSSAEPERPAAGWYADPRGGHRWWDGDLWTQHRQSKEGVVWTDSTAADSAFGDSAVQQATSPSALGTILGLLGSLVLFFSTFSRWMTIADGQAFNAYDRGLPWLLSGADYDPVFDRGWLGHGLLYFAFSLVGLYLVIMASQGRSSAAGGRAALVGVGAFFLTLLNAFVFRSAFSTLNEAGSSAVGIGIGLWLALLASMAIIASGVLLASRR